jgi:hypothetical protein
VTVGAKCLQVAQIVVVAVAVYMVDIKLASVDRKKSTHFANLFLVLSVDIFRAGYSFRYVSVRLLAVIGAEFSLLSNQRI